MQDLNWGAAGGVTRQSMASSVAARILQVLHSNQADSGTILPPERRLAEELGVSRTTVREAISELALRGVVQRRHGSGTVLRVATAEAKSMLDRLASQDQNMSDIVDFRLSLEPQIAAMAAVRRTDADLIVLENICKTNPLELDQEGSYSLDYQFHLALATATQNHLILTLSQSMYEWIAVARKQIHSTRNGRDTSFNGHVKIFEAVVAGDDTRAQIEMRTHIEGASQVAIPSKIK